MHICERKSNLRNNSLFGAFNYSCLQFLYGRQMLSAIIERGEAYSRRLTYENSSGMLARLMIELNVSAKRLV